MRRIGVAVLALLLALPAVAQSGNAKKQAAANQQLETLRAQIRQLGAEQRRLEGEKNAAARELREIDGQVSAAQRRLRDTEAGIGAREAELDGLEQRRQALEESLGRQRQELAQLIRSAYALGRRGKLEMLLEQGRISDLARVLAYHRYFQRDRQRRIEALGRELRALAAIDEQVRVKKLALEAARDQQRGELAALAGQRRQRGQQVSALAARFRDRDARLKALGRDERSTIALLERLRRLMAQAAKPAPGSGAPATPPLPGPKVPPGALKLPLAGSVLAGFGGTMPDGHRSQGLLIAGSPGAEVRAVAAGRVAYADWLKGYGLLLILDHGSGWMTLYAFNDSLLKNAGDSVRAGEAVSTVGSSGGQGRAALYFELRRNGQPQDPRSWLKK